MSTGTIGGSRTLDVEVSGKVCGGRRSRSESSLVVGISIGGFDNASGGIHGRRKERFVDETQGTTLLARRKRCSKRRL